MPGKHYKRYAPERVAALIQLANSVAPKLELPTPPRRAGRWMPTGMLMNGPAFDGFRELNHLPKAPAEIPYALYSDLWAARTLLRIAAQYNSRSPEEDKIYFLRSAVFTIAHVPLLFIVPRVDDSGRLRFSLGRILDAFDGVEAERIRQCPICNEIFWKKRSDQKACNTRCANALRVRNWRSPEDKRRRYKNAEWREKRRHPAKKSTRVSS